MNKPTIAFAIDALPLSDGDKIIMLARQITSRQQYESILADAAPALQADLRGMFETILDVAALPDDPEFVQ